MIATLLHTIGGCLVIKLRFGDGSMPTHDKAGDYMVRTIIYIKREEERTT